MARLKPSGKFSKAELRREIARDQRNAARARVRQLRAAVADLRKRRKEAIAEARSKCRAGRLEAADRARALRLRLLSEMRAAVVAERQAARGACDARVSSARGLRSEIEQARAAYEAERKFQADMRRIEGGNKRTMALAKRADARARRSESDDEVRGNIPPETIALFNRIRRSIKGSDRMSRTEAFLHYAEENPHEVIEAIEELSQRSLARMEREAEKAARDAQRAELAAQRADEAAARERLERAKRRARDQFAGRPLEDAPF